MNQLQEMLTHRVLARKAQMRNEKLTDAVLDGKLSSVDDDVMSLRNVCAKLHVSLADRLDQAVTELDISKRQFIETSLIAALDEYDRACEGWGLTDLYEEIADRQEASDE